MMTMKLTLENDSDCISYNLVPDILNDATLMDPSLNRVFEGLACDALAQKLFIA